MYSPWKARNSTNQKRLAEVEPRVNSRDALSIPQAASKWLLCNVAGVKLLPIGWM
jgi:hypothetical protein